MLTEVKLERQKLPASLLQCAPAPAVPMCQAQSCVAGYVVELWSAGADCRAKLDSVRGLVDAGS